MLSVAAATRLTSGKRQALLSQLQTTQNPNAQVVLATPRRFISTRKLIRPNEAIDGMLDVFVTAQSICAQLGLTSGFSISETPLPQAPRLYLSHHTIETDFAATLRANGANVRHFKAADLPGRTILDPQGFSGWSSLAQAKVDSLPLSDIDQAKADDFFALATVRATENQSKYTQSTQSKPIVGPYVFVALQTIGDMVQRCAFVPMLEMLAMVVARFAGTSTTVVIKRHPKCRSRRVAQAVAAAATSQGVIVSTGSIHALLADAQAVFTVNSGVGSEAIVHGTPIYCFGASDYAAVAHQVRTADDLTHLTNPICHRCDPETLRRFHYYYRNAYQIDRTTQLRPRLTALIKQSVQTR